MTDERLRELERAFQQSGSPEDELAWLQARVRTGAQLDWGSYQRLAELNVEAASEYLLGRVARGEMERENLKLAAYLGHAPASGLGLGEHSVPADLDVFVRKIIFLSEGNAAFESEPTTPGESLPTRAWGRTAAARAALAAARAMGEFPDPTAPSAVEFLALMVAEECIAEGDLQRYAEPAAEAAGPFFSALEVVGSALQPEDYSDAWVAADAGEAARAAADLIGEEAVIRTIRSELVPWALGFGDPVLDRVEARQREAAGG